MNIRMFDRMIICDSISHFK